MEWLRPFPSEQYQHDRQKKTDYIGFSSPIGIKVRHKL